MVSYVIMDCLLCVPYSEHGNLILLDVLSKEYYCIRLSISKDHNFDALEFSECHCKKKKW